MLLNQGNSLRSKGKNATNPVTNKQKNTGGGDGSTPAVPNQPKSKKKCGTKDSPTFGLSLSRMGGEGWSKLTEQKIL